MATLGIWNLEKNRFKNRYFRIDDEMTKAAPPGRLFVVGASDHRYIHLGRYLVATWAISWP